MIKNQEIKIFTSGTSNLLPDDVIKQDAASDSINWRTTDGKIELVYGRQAQGAVGGAGKSYGEHKGYKVDGTSVRFRKIGSKIQTLVGSTWTDVITGLTATADYTFTNYQSLAGAFVYIFGPDGIYKIVTANPTSYTSLYDSTKNFKGYAFIDKARAILWGRAKDPTGLYGSYIDKQNGTVYTTVTGEATTSLTGTLAFKAGGATRTAFGLLLTLSGSGEVFTDTLNGTLTGSLGNTGTINYTTGAYTLSVAGTGTVNYQWENTNNKGVTDFSYSATRLAGEGFVVRQDGGGDAIQVVIPDNGSYFSMKKQSAYRFQLDGTDLNPTNEQFRTDIGVPGLRSAVATSLGIMFMNTASPTKPKLSLLRKNPLGDNFDVKDLFTQYDFSKFYYNDCLVDFWDKYAIVGCSTDGLNNNRLLLCDPVAKTVDATNYGIRASCKDNGLLYGGDSISETTYELFTGFDDLGFPLINYWDSKGETYGSNSLKKVRYFRFKGKIAPTQEIAIYFGSDNGDKTLIGTILGSGGYVDYGVPYSIGTVMIGNSVLGASSSSNIYEYYLQIKVRSPKFYKRILRFEAKSIGYASIEYINDFDIMMFEQKLPSKYRTKQNVSLDGEQTGI